MENREARDIGKGRRGGGVRKCSRQQKRREMHIRGGKERELKKIEEDKRKSQE